MNDEQISFQNRKTQFSYVNFSEIQNMKKAFSYYNII